MTFIAVSTFLHALFFAAFSPEPERKPLRFVVQRIAHTDQMQRFAGDKPQFQAHSLDRLQSAEVGWLELPVKSRSPDVLPEIDTQAADIATDQVVGQKPQWFAE